MSCGLGHDGARAPSGALMFRTVELARRWGVNNVTIVSWLKAGKLKGFRLGNTWLIPAAEVFARESGEKK
jgi:excisionase family DNA binding protein